VRQHPLSLPTRGFRNNGGLDLSGLGVLALPPPDPSYVAMPLDCGGQPPQTWHDDLCGFIETLFQRRVDGLKPASTYVPLDCPPGPGPPSGASLGGPTMGQIGWVGPSTGPTPFFGATGVSPLWCEPLRAGRCCGGERVLCVS